MKALDEYILMVLFITRPSRRRQLSLKMGSVCFFVLVLRLPHAQCVIITSLFFFWHGDGGQFS